MYSRVVSIPLRVEPYSNTLQADNWNKTSVSLLGIMPNHNTESTPRNAELNHKPRMERSENEIKRGLNIGLKIRVPSTPAYNKELDKLEQVIKMAKMDLQNNLGQVLNTSDCPKCDEEEGPSLPDKVKPAYKCDEWDAKSRLCLLERNIGDTVTFYLSTGKSVGLKPKVTWKKEFHMRNSDSRTAFVIDPDNSPENIIIGKQGYELRISPITETDIGYNLFSASLGAHASVQSKVHFMIRIVPIDLGFVYVGETIELNLRSYVSFPIESCSITWYMEKYGEHSSLPSNMRTSTLSTSIKISELRQDQEGILACSVYTNFNFLATRKRFLMKDLIKNNDVLKSPPDHNLHFKEENTNRLKRYPKKFIRVKKDINADDIDKALMEATPEETRLPESKEYGTVPDDNDYDIEMAIGKPEPTLKSKSNFAVPVDGGPRGRPVDISVENNPVDVEQSDDRVLENYRDQNADGLQVDTIMVNGQESNDGIKNTFNQHSSSKALGTGNKLGINKNNFNGSPSGLQKYLITNKNGESYGSNIVDDKRNYGLPTEGSEVVLNIEKIPGPRRIDAEEKISKLISFCYNDYDCSGVATCVKSNLKQPGYCKCLPGFHGVGIFCREDIWMSKNNFGMDSFPNSNDIPNSINSPIRSELI